MVEIPLISLFTALDCKLEYCSQAKDKRGDRSLRILTLY